MKLQLLYTFIFITLATLYIQQDQNFQEIDNSDLSNYIQDQEDGELQLQSEVNLQLPQPVKLGIVSKRSSSRWCTKYDTVVACDKPNYQHKSEFRFYKLNNYYLIRSYDGYCEQYNSVFSCVKSYENVMKNGNQHGQWQIEHHGDYRAIRNKVSGQYLSAQYEIFSANQVHYKNLKLYVNRNQAHSWEKFKLIEK